ncbi:MAG: glycosyltransferase [Candidatus Hodarchaeales archaeon]|jgi:1,2-diacylglycerol 3-alpha-glucosyltransferase
MKIGIFSDTWLPNINGVTFSIINEIKALEDQHEFVLFVPKTHQRKLGLKVDCPVYEVSGFEFPSYPGYRISFPLSGVLKKAIKNHHLDFLHIHSPFSLGYYGLFAKKLCRLPSAATFHTWLSEYVGHLTAGFAEETVKELLEVPTWKYTRWFYGKNEIVITPSKMFEREMNRWSVNNAVAVPNPISPVFFNHKAKKEQVTAFKKKFGIPQDKTVLLYVGRISFEKRLETLFKAYKNLESTKYGKELFLVVVGDGPHLNSYKKLAISLELKNCVFTGYWAHQNLPTVYYSGDIFISPSDTETQGLTYIEAMASRVPVIGTKAGGVVDYIQHGYSGLLACERTPEEFEKLIIYALENKDKMEKITSNAAKVAENYSYKGFRKNMNSAFKLAIEIHREKKMVS